MEVDESFPPSARARVPRRIGRCLRLPFLMRQAVIEFVIILALMVFVLYLVVVSLKDKDVSKAIAAVPVAMITVGMIIGLSLLKSGRR